MHLSVTCPQCESKYQLDSGMRGKRMRCPNPICRAIFEVRDDSDPKAEAPPVAPESLTPGPSPTRGEGRTDVAPTPAKVEVKKEPPKPPEPVKRKPIPKPIEPQPALDFPDDFPGDDEAAPAPSAPAIATEAWQPEAWDAPPVREDVALAPQPIAPPMLVTAPAPVKRRRALWVIGTMLILLGIVVGVSLWRVRGSIATNETERYQKAEELYKQQEFAEASSALQKLVSDFPESPENKKYRILAELSDVRQAVRLCESSDDTQKAFERVLQFAGVYSGEKLLKERETDLWKTYDDLAKELTRLGEQEKSSELVLRAKQAWGAAKKYPPPAGTSKDERERKLTDEWTRIEQMLAVHFERENVVASLKKHLDRPDAASVQEAWLLVEKTKRQDDSEIRGLMDELVKAHREQIKFVPANPETKRAILSDDAFPSLSVTPTVKEGTVAVTQPLVLSLARGVLYVLEPSKGEIRWVRRVGIDTHLLPLRVPADAITPELLLVVSSDQRSLSALIADTGEVLWQTPLSDVCLGQPVLVDRQVLVPTLAGRIEEIEIAEGRHLGSYHLGQPLMLGGVRQPGTSLVYFPADEFCLYVIDVTKRTCTNILYTRHPAGSLRGLPVIATSDKGAVLLWSQAQGADRVEIKPYELPIGHPEQKPAEPILQLPAISAPPWCEADRLVVATQNGFLSLWGVQQKGTRDKLLFPLLKQDFPLDASPGRGQVVHADAENYWTLTRSGLQRVQSTFDPKQGPSLSKPWTQPTALGALLHAAQVRREAGGRTILFLTTQADDHPTCLASAVDAADGKILWQRQLGVLPQQAPLRIGDQIVVRDANGLLRFDAAKQSDKAEQRWQQAGDWLAQEGGTGATRILLARENSYVQLTLPRGGTKARILVGQLAGDQKPQAFEVTLPAPLQGTTALGEKFLLVPLADGIIAQINLQDKSLTKDLDWRAVGAEEQSSGHLVLLSQTDCVVTDGSRGLMRIGTNDGKSWSKRAEAKKLPHRITSPPVVLPAPQNGKPRVCVADASDTLTLFESDKLKDSISWNMPGKITAGPFVRGGKIGCVVGRNQLVWIDPEQKKFVWEYTFDADIVGEPQVIEGRLVVADVAGQFHELQPSDGSRIGAVLTLKANVAATAAPLSFGPGQAFAPLTDGTIVLVPLSKLRASN
jgi:outer membrane protein assembly factor BamB